MTTILSPQRNDIDSLLPSEEVIDNEVLSVHGRRAGHVAGFYFDDDTVKGLHVIHDNHDYFIDIQYVKEYKEEAVMLTMQPFYALQGVNVYDGDGRYLGTVRDITRKPNTNAIQELIVKKYVFSTPTTIPYDDVDTAKDSIILNETYDNN